MIYFITAQKEQLEANIRIVAIILAYVCRSPGVADAIPLTVMRRIVTGRTGTIRAQTYRVRRLGKDLHETGNEYNENCAEEDGI